MRILAIDSCTKACSAALYDNGKILASFNLNCALTHSQTLLPTIKQMLKEVELELENMDYIAVSVGPGSFTGIRIGLATAKGLAHANNTPLIGVSTLEALCYNVPYFEGIICPCLDARRSQVYNALFKFEDGVLRRLSPDRAISAEDLKQELLSYSEKICFIGDGAYIGYNTAKDVLKSVQISENLNFIRADSVAMAAANETALCTFKEQAFNEINPVYLRLSQAEREKLEKEGK